MLGISKVINNKSYLLIGDFRILRSSLWWGFICYFFGNPKISNRRGWCLKVSNF